MDHISWGPTRNHWNYTRKCPYAMFLSFISIPEHFRITLDHNPITIPTGTVLCHFLSRIWSKCSKPRDYLPPVGNPLFCNPLYCTGKPEARFSVWAHPWCSTSFILNFASFSYFAMRFLFCCTGVLSVYCNKYTVSNNSSESHFFIYGEKSKLIL